MKWYTFLLSLLLFLSACSESQTENPVYTDAEALSFYFDLSQLPKPDSLQWTQKVIGASTSRLPGSTDYQVLAVLEFNELTAEQLKELLSLPTDYHSYTIPDDMLESVFPARISESFTQTTNGDLEFNGSVYNSESLLRSPLSYGNALIIENYILLFGGTT